VNTTYPSLSNKSVRQALSYALDRKRIVDSALLGYGQPNALPWGPTSAGYDAAKNNSFAFDLDKARSLLQSAGAAGISMDIVYTATANAQIVQIYQADLAKIGVNATLRPTEGPAFAQAVVTQKYQGIALITILQSQLQMGTQVFGPFYTPNTNWAGFRNDQYAALAHQVATETDPAKQKAVYSQFNDFVLDQSFVVPICSNAPVVVSKGSVNGLAYAMNEGLSVTRAWLA
jgi:peptide/nickel transport system substrate-binding protein